MKTFTPGTLLLVFFAFQCSSLLGQPVISSSSVLPSAGIVDSLYGAAATVPPGSGGAGVTWDFSSLALSPEGTVTIANPSATPYSATFPTANFCLQIFGGASVYNYIHNSSAGQETVATSYAGTGTGQDYAPNPRLEIPYPFNYLDSVIDTFQMTTSSPQAETLTYDGYGTLITPLHTYANVIRVKENYGGSDYHYAWYTASPLMLVLNYSNTGGNYVYIDANPATAGINNASSDPASALLFPNPFSQNATLEINDCRALCNASAAIYDLSGRVVKQIPVKGAETMISRDGLCPGIYFYYVQNNGVKIASGKMIIQ